MHRCQKLLIITTIFISISISIHAQQHPDSTLALELLDKTERLEEDIRHIRGELEIQRHQIEMVLQNQALVGTQQYDNQETTQELNNINKEQPELSKIATTPANKEQLDFDMAISILQSGHHNEATIKLRDFLTQYPASKYSSEALYWLGEAYYGNSQYVAARDTFLELGLHYPHAKQLPAALLKLGEIYRIMDSPKKEREVLMKLIKIYPETEAAKLAEKLLQQLPNN